jgi:hypothetical protein
MFGADAANEQHGRGARTSSTAPSANRKPGCAGLSRQGRPPGRRRRPRVCEVCGGPLSPYVWSAENVRAVVRRDLQGAASRTSSQGKGLDERRRVRPGIWTPFLNGQRLFAMKLVVPRPTYVYLGWSVYNHVLPCGKRSQVRPPAGKARTLVKRNEPRLRFPSRLLA